MFQSLENLSEATLLKILEDKDKYGNTALGLVCIRNNEELRKKAERFECVKMLIKKRANPNVQNPNTLFTPLHFACVHGATDVVTLLIEN